MKRYFNSALRMCFDSSEIWRRVIFALETPVTLATQVTPAVLSVEFVVLLVPLEDMLQLVRQPIFNF